MHVDTPPRRPPAPVSVAADPAPGRWRALILLSLAVVGVLSTWFSATAIAPELMQLWDMGPGQGAWLTNAVQLGFVLGAVAASLVNLPDLIPMTRLIAVSAALAAASNLALIWAPDGATAIALRLLTGVALAGVYPPALKLMSTWFRRGRGLALGGLVGALTLGSSMPHLVRALAGALNWQTVVLASSAGAAAGALLTGLLLREGPFGFGRARFDPRQTLAILRDRPVMLVNLGYCGHMWELYAMWAWLLAFATAAQAGGLTPYPFGSAPMLTFVAVAAGVPGCLFAGWMSDRAGRCTTTIVMMAVSGGCAAGVGFAFDGPGWLLAAIVVIWGFSIVGDSAQFSAAVTELSTPELTGTALTLQMGVGYALTMVAIRLLPAVADALGSWQWVFVVLAPGPVIGLIAMARLRRHPEALRLAHGRR